MTYVPAEERYDRMPYRRSGRSGLLLPAISLGLWWNFGAVDPFERNRAIVRRAFDLGITHFDLANNYGPPYGSAEETFGRLLREDLRPYRDELVISTKAGYDMWPGPYGEWGSRKYLLASLDQSLARMGLDYVDIFYSHRFDPETPLEETMGALDSAVRAGKALYAGISSYSAEQTREAAAILRALGTPLLIHQPSYSMLNRWIEPDLLDAVGELGVGCIVFSPLAQGMLTSKYLDGIPAGSRASRPSSLSPDLISDEALSRIRAPERDRRAARPDAGAARARVDAPRLACDLGPHRRLERRPARGQRRRTRPPRVRRGRAGRDRPLRDGHGHQHLGAVERGALALRLELLREELERGLRLRLLLPGEIDSLRAEEGSRLRRDLERVCSSALRRELEDPRAVGVEPQLRDEPSAELCRPEVQLENEERPQHGELVQLGTGDCVIREERALLLRESLRIGRSPAAARRTARASVFPLRAAEHT